MKKILIVSLKFVGIIFITITIILVIMILTPYLMPSEKMRDDILKLTPIGMHMDKVWEVIESQDKWRLMTWGDKRGYTNHSLPAGQREVGKKHITVDIGKSNPIWYSKASWGFDENGLLIDVHVAWATNN